jgi:hypothetical protein
MNRHAVIPKSFDKGLQNISTKMTWPANRDEL